MDSMGDSMKRLLSILLLGMMSGPGLAEDLSQPVNHYIKDRLEVREGFQEVWKAVYWGDYSSERNDPNGGYLYRFQYQFKGAKDTLVFVASDRDGSPRHDLLAWSIYQKTPQNEWGIIAVDAAVRVRAKSIQDEARTIVQVFPERFGDRKTFTKLRINAEGTTELKSYQGEKPNAQIRSLFEDPALAQPNVEKIPLAAYLRSPKAGWRPLSEHGLAAQSLDPEDAPLLASVQGMDWAEAVKLCQALPRSDVKKLPTQNCADESSEAELITAIQNDVFNLKQMDPAWFSAQSPNRSTPMNDDETLLSDYGRALSPE